MPRWLLPCSLMWWWSTPPCAPRSAASSVGAMDRMGRFWSLVADIANWKMVIEIDINMWVSTFLNGDFPELFVSLPECNWKNWLDEFMGWMGERWWIDIVVGHRCHQRISGANYWKPIETWELHDLVLEDGVRNWIFCLLTPEDLGIKQDMVMDSEPYIILYTLIYTGQKPELLDLAIDFWCECLLYNHKDTS